MKISLNWLKNYIPFQAELDKVLYYLTMAGLEVEKVQESKEDVILELEVTPNRPDCLSIIGIARELGAVLKKNLRLPLAGKLKFPKTKIPIAIEDKNDCYHYAGVVIKGVGVHVNSGWIQECLNAIGARTINNIVDITNFCLMEQGQPLHAFDYDKLEGGKIIVRRATAGEKIITIDGVERALDPSILVIADAKKPVAIAGIMGGKETEVTERTKNILLESAAFNPILIRRASRKLALTSDSSYRFERGIDRGGVWPGALRALGLISEEAGGEIAQKAEVLAAKPVAKKAINISAEEINALLGTDLKNKECVDILKRLGLVCRVKKKKIAALPPSFRGDLNRPVDLIEEIARIVGYDKLPLAQPKVSVTAVVEDAQYAHIRRIRNFIVAQGLDEVITHSMFNSKLLKKSGQENLQGIKIKNPLSADQELMRPSLLPNLLLVAHNNLHKGVKSFKFFELGKIYSNGQEEDVLSVVLSGSNYFDWRQGKAKTLDYFDLKGILEKLFEYLHVERFSTESLENSIFDPVKSARVVMDKQDIGQLGELSVSILGNFDLKVGQMLFAEIRLEKIYSLICSKGRFESLSEFPSITRDVSLAVKKDVSYRAIEQFVLGQGQGILRKIEFVEEYLGEKIPQGQRGLIFSLSYQKSDRTLREDEIQPVHERILKSLSEQFNATIR